MPGGFSDGGGVGNRRLNAETIPVTSLRRSMHIRSFIKKLRTAGNVNVPCNQNGKIGYFGNVYD